MNMVHQSVPPNEDNILSKIIMLTIILINSSVALRWTGKKSKVYASGIGNYCGEERRRVRRVERY